MGTDWRLETLRGNLFAARNRRTQLEGEVCGIIRTQKTPDVAALKARLENMDSDISYHMRELADYEAFVAKGTKPSPEAP